MLQAGASGPERSQDEAGCRDRSLADHLADASRQPHLLSSQMLRRLGTKELQVAEARLAAHPGPITGPQVMACPFTLALQQTEVQHSQKPAA